MAWNEARSRQRIQDHRKTVPEFDENLTLAKQRRMMVEARQKGLMDQMSRRRAFVVEGAHVYGQFLDFDTLVASADGTENEASHRNILRFLNAQYRLWDSIVESDEADRVDYHGARMHAIVSIPANDPAGQIERAVALSVQLAAATKRIGEYYGVSARIRFGIDQGMCVAMTTGRSHEKDTLFLGAPANHAAKTAAASDEEGIFLAQNAEQIVGHSALAKTARGTIIPNVAFISEAVKRNPFDTIDHAASRLIYEAGKDPEFVFHRATPPLSSIRFADLTPSNSVRMGMASLFADIDGFTAFVDDAIRNGSEAIKLAAANIHVIREELNCVLRDDFGGKRVRFIGDCIQGVLSEGDRRDDPESTVTETALCAAGMKASFSLCQEILDEIDELDLAIGIEYGPIPLTRIGQRGDDSVRCAAGRAVVISERVQQQIEGGGVRLGPTALSYASQPVKRHFASASTIPTYDAAADLLGALASPAVQVVREDPTARPYVKAIER